MLLTSIHQYYPLYDFRNRKSRFGMQAVDTSFDVNSGFSGTPHVHGLRKEKVNHFSDSTL